MTGYGRMLRVGLLVLAFVACRPQVSNAQSFYEKFCFGVWTFSYDLSEALHPDGTMPSREELDAAVRTHSGFWANPGTANVVADGTSRLLLYDDEGLYSAGDTLQTIWTILTPGDLEFTGRLISLDGSQSGRTVSDTVMPYGGHYRWAIYEAPKTFGSDVADARGIEIRADVPNADQYGFSEEFDGLVYVRRPPVLMLHGLWSHPDVWATSGFSNALGAYFPGLTLHAEPLVDASGPFDLNVRAVRQGVANALQAIKAQAPASTVACTPSDPSEAEIRGYDHARTAAIQADVVGHSMGGDLARTWATMPGFKNPSNFNKGTIHSIITVDTPHQPAFLAQLLVQLRNAACTNIALATCHLYSDVLRTVMRVVGMPDGKVLPPTALDDLASVNLPAYQGDAFAIAGQFPFPGTPIPDQAFSFPQPFNLIYMLLDRVGFLTSPLPAGDGIVSTVSQMAGLNGPVTQMTLHPGVALGIGALEKVANQHHTRDLLTGDEAFANGFPATPTFFAASMLATRGFSDLDSALVVISAPAEGATVAPGAVVDVTVDRAPGASVGRGLVVAPGDPLVAPIDSLPTTVQFSVPADFAGAFTIVAWASDTMGNSGEPVERTINVVPPSSLVSLTVAPDPVRLGGAGDEQVLLVAGHYGDGIDRSIADGSSGTTYASTDPTVATVSAAGRVQATGEGQTSIVVSHGASSVVLPVEVSLMYSPKCGNGALDAGEQCDPLLDTSGCCSPGCKLVDCPGGRPITGASLLVADATNPTRRKISFVSRDPAIATTLANMNPATGGARLLVYNPSTGEAVCLPLSRGSWRAAGAGSAAHYSYRDHSYANGPCSSAILSPIGLLKVTCRAKVKPIAYSLDEAAQGSLGVNFISERTVYCATFGGGGVKSDFGLPVTGSFGRFNGKASPPPAACPVPPIGCPDA